MEAAAAEAQRRRVVLERAAAAAWRRVEATGTVFQMVLDSYTASLRHMRGTDLRRAVASCARLRGVSRAWRAGLGTDDIWREFCELVLSPIYMQCKARTDCQLSWLQLFGCVNGTSYMYCSSSGQNRLPVLDLELSSDILDRLSRKNFPQAAAKMVEAKDLPAGWTKHMSTTAGYYCFCNRSSGEIQWNVPEGTSTENINSGSDPCDSASAVQPDCSGYLLACEVCAYSDRVTPNYYTTGSTSKGRLLSSYTAVVDWMPGSPSEFAPGALVERGTFLRCTVRLLRKFDYKVLELVDERMEESDYGSMLSRSALFSVQLSKPAVAVDEKCLWNEVYADPPELAIPLCLTVGKLEVPVCSCSGEPWILVESMGTTEDIEFEEVLAFESRDQTKCEKCHDAYAFELKRFDLEVDEDFVGPYESVDLYDYTTSIGTQADQDDVKILKWADLDDVLKFASAPDCAKQWAQGIQSNWNPND